MAQGDPMVLRTVNLMGDYYDFETDANSDGLADGWTLWYDAHSSSRVTALDNTAPYSGTYNQKLTYTSDAATSCSVVSPLIALPGRSDLSGNGHYGSTIKASAYLKRGNALGQTGHVAIQFYDADEVFVSQIYSADTALTDSWVKHEASMTVPATAVYIRIVMFCSIGSAQTGVIFHIDNADLYEEYTFSKNPSMPENNDYSYIRSDFKNIAGDMVSLVLNDDVEKISGQFSFGLITEAQMLALRSLWSWKQPLIWTPYLNKLPTTLTIMLDEKFNFNAVSQNLSAGYSGAIKYEEV